MKNKLILSFSILLLFFISGKAQNVFIPDNQGRAVTEKKYENLNGTPYLNENWSIGLVKLDDGKIFKDVELKYDLVNDDVLFKGKNNEDLQFVNQVVEFKLNDQNKPRTFKSGFDVKGNTPNNFYEILYDGGIKLLKKTKKVIIEAKGYNSATVTKNVNAFTKYYYVDKSNHVVEFKNNKKDVLNLFKDKSNELSQLISSEKLDFKSEEDLVKIFVHYNKS